MSASVKQRLSASLATATKAGQTIASYMLANINALPFETAASVARKAGVSEPMIGRYCRSIGFASFKDLKTDLKDDIGARPWLIGDRLKELQRQGLPSKNQLARNLELEMAGLVRIYEFLDTGEWQRVVKRLAAAQTIFVAGFQTERGMAQLLAHQMQYLRPGVQLVDLASGNFTDVLLSGHRPGALVIFETRRHSRLARLLAREARSAGIPATLITDSYCHWGHEAASEVFAVPTDFDFFWDSTALMASLINLLVSGIFTELGPKVEERMDQVSSLYSKFTGYVGDSSGPQY